MNRLRRRKLTSIAILVAVLGAFLWNTRPALAHARVELGPYVIIIGWQKEPPIVGERNALLLDISKGDEPVEGVEGTLDLEILYGGRTFTGNLQPTSTPGQYIVEILPTVRGQYSVQLSGSIEDLAVDELADPEEVLPAAVLQFPESPPDTRDLKTDIDDLNSQLQTTRIIAIGGLAFGLLGIVAGTARFARARKRS